MLIKCEQTPNNYWTLFCHSCGKRLDTVSVDCLSWHLANEIEPFCMDCDNVRAEEIPPALVEDGPQYLLIIDGKPIIINWHSAADGQRQAKEIWKQAFEDYMADQRSARR